MYLPTHTLGMILLVTTISPRAACSMHVFLLASISMFSGKFFFHLECHEAMG